MKGILLGNRYEVLEKIGTGGMAYVYKGKCKLLNRYVAIKVLKEDYLEDENFVRKFKRESQAAASLSHPNILNIYDVGIDKVEGKDVHYIVMEYIDGKTLKDIINENGSLEEERVINYGIQIAEALQNAHKNHIIHRDIKPQNIMITEDDRVKVTDFGIARAVTSSTLTTTSSALGSVHYFSPEQARGGYTDVKSDIYSLGIVLYEMITGKMPYDGETPISVALKHVQENIVPPREVNQNISQDLENIILKCVKKLQIDRYPNVEELLKDLKRVGTGMVPSPDIFKNSDTVLGDDSTKFIPIVTEDIKDEESILMGDKSKPTKANREKNRKKRSTIAAIVLAFLFVTTAFVGAVKIRDFLAVEEIIVPNIVGLQKDDAKKVIEDLGLRFNVRNTVVNDEFDPGAVVSQSVAEGSRVRKNFVIDVLVAEGQDFVRVPSLINKKYEEALEILEEAGLRIGEIKYEASDVTPEDMVMRQEPSPGSNLEKNSRVNLVISEGEEVRMVIMPDLLNKTLIDAKNTMIALDLQVREAGEQHSEEIPKGRVVWQEYEPGTELESKMSVDIYISLGKEEVEIPEVVEPDNREEPEVTSPPSENNIEKTVELVLTPFTDREETVIKIFKVDNGNKSEVYNKNHKRENGDVRISFKGKVGSEFEIYFDDIYQYTRRINE